jgi:multiple sugar transport system permease protein
MGFIVPALLLVAAFLALPGLYTLWLGSTNYQLYGPFSSSPAFVGFSNYIQTLVDSGFRAAFLNSVLYVFFSAIIGQVVLGVTLAWLLRRVNGLVKTVVESLMIFAWIIPAAVVAYLWYAFLNPGNGTLAVMLGWVHLSHLAQTQWLYADPLLSLIVFNIWRGTAFSYMLSGAAINTVPPSHLETAELSGASQWQQLRDIVLPNIKGVLFTNMLLITLWTFNDFTPYLLVGSTNPSALLLPTYAYAKAFQFDAFGLGSAISTIIIVINVILGLGYLFLLRKKKAA